MIKSRINKSKGVPGGMYEVILIAFPMMVSHLSETILMFTDRLFLAKVNSAQMNAAMSGGMTSFMMISFFIGLLGYTGALVAQNYGAKREHNCAVVTTQAFIVAFFSYGLILLIKPLSNFVINLDGMDAEQLSYHNSYFNIIYYANILNILRAVLAGFFTGIGRPKVVMIAALVTMFLNMIFNYILIFGKLGFPEMGIVGAAYGSIAAALIGVLILLATYFSAEMREKFGTHTAFEFRPKEIKRLLYYGSPTGVELVLNMVAFTFLILLMHSLGREEATASTIVFNWDQVSFIPLIGLEIAVTSLVGRYMGGGDPQVARKVARSALKIGWIFSGVVFLAFVAIPGVLVDLFKPENVDQSFLIAREMAIFMIPWAAVYVLGEAIFVVYVGLLRGAGDTYWAMIITVAMHWLMIPMFFLGRDFFEFDIKGIWMLIVVVLLLAAGVIYARYKFGRWHEIKVLD